MYKLLTNAVVKSVRVRKTQGDCPVEPAYPAETIENALLDLAGRLPRRCDTNLAAPNGECIACCADQGVACRSPTVSERSEAQ
jgi:hypothetical protein